ncbi:MAG: glycosyltransferase family 39 protein [Mariniblastus sp.]|nr:glycosyltransferase family 39 protein [Mariniblastus sp.]
MTSYRQLGLIGLALLVALVAIVLRWMISLNEPLWIDELHTAWSVDGPLDSVASRAAQGNQTPLYFWLEWLVCRQFGLTEFWLRLPSMLYGSLTAVAASLLVWKFQRAPMAALTAGLLIAIDPLFLFYGSEARPYALLHLLSLLQVFFFIREMEISQDPARVPRRRVPTCLAILTALMLWTHLTAVLLVVTELLFLLFFARRFPVKAPLISIAVGSLALLPMTWLAMDVFSKRQDWQTVSDSGLLIRQLWPAPLICVMVPALTGWLVSWRKTVQSVTQPATQPSQQRWIPWLAWPLAWGLTPLLLLWFADLSGLAPAAMNRYAQVGAPAWPVLCGVLLARIPVRSYRFAASLLVLAVAIFFSGNLGSLLEKGMPGRHRHENWAAAVNLINSKGTTGPLFLFSNLIEDHQALPRTGSGSEINQDKRLAYLSFPVTGIHKIKSGITVIPRPTLPNRRFTPSDLAAVQKNGGAWLLVRGDPRLTDVIAAELENGLALPAGQSSRVDVWELTGSLVYVARLRIVPDESDSSKRTAD